MLASLKSKITDQEEQIQTLIKKRRDDLEKLKEFERTKLQLDQVKFPLLLHSAFSHFLSVTILQTRSPGTYERTQRKITTARK